MAKGWRECGLYVHRTRKPHAFLGLPIIGRHFAYVGQTSSRYHRDRQHRYGGGRWNAVAKPYTDLDLKIYPWPCVFPRWEWARKTQEKFWILVLLPVYNDEWNKANPRRIPIGKAEAQRWARDAARGRYGIGVNLGRAAARWALMLTVLAGAGWSAWEMWVR